jgi:anti-anti-sigma factor
MTGRAETGTATEPTIAFAVRIGGPSRLHLCGELDMAGAATFARALEPLTTAGGTVEIDLADLTFIDSSGINVLCHALGDLGGRGRLVVLRPTAAVRHTLELTGLDRVIEISGGPSASSST